MRMSAKRFGREVQCGRGLLNAEPLPGVPLSQAVGRLPPDQRRSVMSWLTSAGPFWDDSRRHGLDDYLECQGEIVTESGMGEAAFRYLLGIDCALLSIVPSDWDYAPITVAFKLGEGERTDREVVLRNWRTVLEVESGLAEAEPPMGAWADVERTCRRRYTQLFFSPGAFGGLSGVPFAKSSAERIITLLGILDRKAGAFDHAGEPTDEGRRIDRDYFSGANALFTDSSATEKRELSERLVFPHPTKPGESLWCSWHGKERHLALRLHFTWPIRHRQPIYIVYVGPKRTKR